MAALLQIHHNHWIKIFLTVDKEENTFQMIKVLSRKCSTNQSIMFNVDLFFSFFLAIFASSNFTVLYLTFLDFLYFAYKTQRTKLI